MVTAVLPGVAYCRVRPPQELQHFFTFSEAAKFLMTFFIF